MSNGSKQTRGYATLERKVYLRVALITLLALLAVFLLLALTNNRMGDFIVSVLIRLFNMPYEDASYFYFTFISQNVGYLVCIAVAVFFIILSRFLLTQFSKYFNEISASLDVLVNERDGEIQLSSELASMEHKLKTIRQALERRELEARSAEQRKNDMVMYLAHDIKTPLTSVIGYLNLLEEAPDMPTDQKAKYVHISLEKAYRLERLIDEFFEITRYNSQTMVLTRKDIDLYYMLAQIADEFFPLLSAKGKCATLDVPESLTVHGDPDKLARVFNNVLKNAIAYGEGNSAIGIRALTAGNAVVIEFRNEGHIPESELTSIFDTFYRLDSARSSDTGGAGLGLAIAREIVNAHNGSIFAANEGAYTVFTIRLPLTPAYSPVVA